MSAQFLRLTCSRLLLSRYTSNKFPHTAVGAGFKTAPTFTPTMRHCFRRGARPVALLHGGNRSKLAHGPCVCDATDPLLARGTTPPLSLVRKNGRLAVAPTKAASRFVLGSNTKTLDSRFHGKDGKGVPDGATRNPGSLTDCAMKQIRTAAQSGRSIIPKAETSAYTARSPCGNLSANLTSHETRAK